MKSINSTKAPSAIGPYSQAVDKDGFIYISGQLPIDEETGEFAGETIAAQAKQSLVSLSPEEKKWINEKKPTVNKLTKIINSDYLANEKKELVITKNEIDSLCNTVPIGRLALPSEIANHAIFLTSDLNTYLTGQNIIIDGGYTNV